MTQKCHCGAEFEDWNGLYDHIEQTGGHYDQRAAGKLCAMCGVEPVMKCFVTVKAPGMRPYKVWHDDICGDCCRVIQAAADEPLPEASLR